MSFLDLGFLRLTPGEFLKAFHENHPLRIEREARKRIVRSRQIVDSCTVPTYAINTGIGSLKDKKISREDLSRLSHNILKSHACGLGRPLPPDISRLMLLLRIHTLALGFSGVRLELIEKLIELYEKQVFGVVYEHGSVGSSGDLVPLAHIALPLIGEGEVWDGDNPRPAGEVLRRKEIRPIELGSKEGVSLINGTQFMTACALLIWERGEQLLNTANVVAALTLEALRGSRKPFHSFLHERRPIREIRETAQFLWNLLEGSKILESHRDCSALQDAYTLRCIPQVHGTCRIALNELRAILEAELNASTDNPLVSIGSGEILSGGNFHGEPLALALDQIGISFTKLSVMSERRIARMVDKNLSGLPPFLTENGGLNSGLMIPQYTAAGIVSENKVLAHPASADSIPTSANQEDLNSMGSISGKKGMTIVENTGMVVAIELLTALQALDLSLKDHPDLKSSAPLEKIRRECREKIPFLREDQYLRPLMETALGLIRDGVLATNPAHRG